MIRTVLGAVLAVLTCSGQSFEVASIKASPPPDGRPMRIGSTGGPGTPDPGLFTCTNCSLANLVSMAYELRSYQFPGAGDLNTDRFTVSARIPPGTTKEDFRIMQQNLLAERFKLKIHREKKEMQMFDLVVGKNGPKLKESVESAAAGPPPFPSGPPKLDANGYPTLPPGFTGMIIESGKARWQGVRQNMEQIAGMISNQVGRPVTDATGLTGKYDVTLFWSAEGTIRRAPSPDAGPLADAPDAGAGPTLIGALQDQLGLRLESKKGAVDIVVVDHVEKVPTEN